MTREVVLSTEERIFIVASYFMQAKSDSSTDLSKVSEPCFQTLSGSNNNNNNNNNDNDNNNKTTKKQQT